MEAGELRLKWERHNEFSGYTFFLARRPEHGPDTTALAALPQDWLAAIPGSLMVATHLEFRPATEGALDAALAALSQESDTVVAAAVADGAAWVLSDFRLKDGFSRYLVLDRHLQHRQAGRTVQRLLEIETYRVMALLAFPMDALEHLASRNIPRIRTVAWYRPLIWLLDALEDMQTVRQLEFALFDLRLHYDFDPEGSRSVQDLLDEVRREVAVLVPPAWHRFQNSFSHIFAGGYDAGYFSYKWAEVLSADAYAAFEEAGSPFDPETGRRYLEEILSVGGSRPAIESFVAFRGREPKVDALLRHNGMIPA